MRSLNQALSSLCLEDFASQSNTKRTCFIDHLGNSLEKFGFVKIKVPSLKTKHLKKGYKIARLFFNLSHERKMNYYRAESMGLTGYLKVPNNQDYNFVDLEMWMTKSDQPPVAASLKMYPNNGWPQEVLEFQTHTKLLYRLFENCAKVCLKACAFYLGLKENVFTDKVKQGGSILRYLHYLPSLTADKHKDKIILDEHEDVTLISLFTAGSTPGLEIKIDGFGWLPISHDKDGVILAGADMLKFLSGGVFKGGAHRVCFRNGAVQDRVTIIYSSLPRPEVVLEPLISSFKGKSSQIFIPSMSTADYMYKVPHPRKVSS